MKTFFTTVAVTGLLAGSLVVGGCGGGSSSGPESVSKTDVPVVLGGTTSSDASSPPADNTYRFPSSTTDYTYTIANFAAGDKLILPVGPLSVDNNSFADGRVDVIVVTPGNGKLTVTLTNLTSEQDKVLSVNEINALFGEGTVTQQ